MGKVCCWFFTLLREVFLRARQISPLLKNQHFYSKLQFDRIEGNIENYWVTS